LLQAEAEQEVLVVVAVAQEVSEQETNLLSQETRTR
jgi:hypothetical protein